MIEQNIGVLSTTGRDYTGELTNMQGFFGLFFGGSLVHQPANVDKFIVLGRTHLAGGCGVFGRATPAQTPPNSSEVRNSYVY